MKGHYLPQAVYGRRRLKSCAFNSVSNWVSASPSGVSSFLTNHSPLNWTGAGQLPVIILGWPEVVFGVGFMQITEQIPLIKPTLECHGSHKGRLHLSMKIKRWRPFGDELEKNRKCQGNARMSTNSSTFFYWGTSIERCPLKPEHFQVLSLKSCEEAKQTRCRNPFKRGQRGVHSENTNILYKFVPLLP